MERRLQFDALHDPLTQLPNRALLMNHLNHAMTHYNRYKSPGFAVIFIYVDHFKQINDTLGHSAESTAQGGEPPPTDLHPAK